MTNKKHKIFIDEMILHGDQAKAYKTAYPKASDRTAEKNSYRLLLNATISKKIEIGLAEKEEVIKKARIEEIERIAKEQIVSEIEIDAMLSKIIMGTAVRKRQSGSFDKKTGKWLNVSIYEEPDFSERIAAANLLYKRKGSYSPERVEHRASDSFIEMLKIISQKKQMIGK